MIDPWKPSEYFYKEIVPKIMDNDEKISRMCIFSLDIIPAILSQLLYSLTLTKNESYREPTRYREWFDHDETFEQVKKKLDIRTVIHRSDYNAIKFFPGYGWHDDIIATSKREIDRFAYNNYKTFCLHWQKQSNVLAIGLHNIHSESPLHPEVSKHFDLLKFNEYCLSDKDVLALHLIK